MASEALEVHPLATPPDCTVRVPGSKSYTNRALVLAALAAGRSTLDGALFSDDTRYMAGALAALGFAVQQDEDGRRFAVEGHGGAVPPLTVEVFVGNAGTAARFLPPMVALGTGTYTLDGVPRMHKRPIGPLLTALRQLGAEIECLGEPDAVPLRVDGRGLQGGVISLPGNLSSQYVTGLLLSAPYMREGLTLSVEGELVSRPYVEMTCQAMADFGVEVERPNAQTFRVPPGQAYTGRGYRVEPDASGASYFFAAAALTGGRVRVEGLGTRSLQGDLDLVKIFERMGCTVTQTDDTTEVQGPPGGRGLRGVEVDMADLSDVAQTLAVVAPFAEGPTRITGIGFIRRKETDRVGATVAELRRLGVDAVEEDDGILVRPGLPSGARVRTYEDHRMAMAFALVGLRVPGVVVEDPACTSKTFPDYWSVLETLRA